VSILLRGNLELTTMTDSPTHRPDPTVEGADEEEEETEVTFHNDDEANAARLVGLKFYNDGQYSDALDIQYTVVRHFTTKYGMTNALCGLYYLDYGLSQLRMIQSRDSSSAAVAPLDNDSLETCFINLDTARVCFEKQEKESGEDDEDVQIQLAEVRNAIAQVHVEQEDFEKALQEYENEVIIYRGLQSSPQPRKLVSAMYGMADCYMKECDFAEAEIRFQAVIDEIAKLPPGTIDDALTQELADLRDEAKEMKNGKFKAVQELVRQQFLPDDQDVPPPQEVLAQKVPVDTPPHTNPFLSTMPGGDGNSMRSIPLALTSPLPPRENSNSQSVSHFFPQGNSRSQISSGPVHQAQVRKKTKAPTAVEDDAPALKKARCEA
jgi:tetratricopeptide (TPR) repeat protein